MVSTTSLLNARFYAAATVQLKSSLLRDVARLRLVYCHGSFRTCDTIFKDQTVQDLLDCLILEDRLTCSETLSTHYEPTPSNTKKIEDFRC
jgi:hypothetical protein